MILVFDATSLIYLAKVNLLRKLENLPEKKIIPKTVYKEERGIEKGEEDAFLIEELVKKGVFNSRVFLLTEIRNLTKEVFGSTMLT